MNYRMMKLAKTIEKVAEGTEEAAKAVSTVGRPGTGFGWRGIANPALAALLGAGVGAGTQAARDEDPYTGAAVGAGVGGLGYLAAKGLSPQLDPIRSIQRAGVRGSKTYETSAGEQAVIGSPQEAWIARQQHRALRPSNSEESRMLAAAVENLNKQRAAAAAQRAATAAQPKPGVAARLLGKLRKLLGR